MNKGININTAQKILEIAHSVGILNGIYWMYNFPEETIADFDLTYNFIKKNIKLIDNVVDNRFMLPTFSYMYFHPEEFGLDEKMIKQVEDCHKNSDCLDAEWLGIQLTSESQNKVFEIQRLIMQKNKIIVTRSELITTLAKYNRNGD